MVTSPTCCGRGRAAASAGVASEPLRKTFPFSIAVIARAREPSRSGAARNLSSRTPASAAARVHSDPAIHIQVWRKSRAAGDNGGMAKAQTGFSTLGLSHDILAAVAALGYEEPTPVQKETIPVMLSGRDLLAQAAT